MTITRRKCIISIDKIEKGTAVLISQKSQYALRAIFELAKQYGQGLVKVTVVADAQAIPPRFLEVILGQLKQNGLVVSKRGCDGGYELIRPPDELTVGEVLRFVQGPLGPVECIADGKRDSCPTEGPCPFHHMWERVRDAMSGVYDSTTFQDLIESEKRTNQRYVPSYSI